MSWLEIPKNEDTEVKEKVSSNLTKIESRNWTGEENQNERTTEKDSDEQTTNMTPENYSDEEVKEALSAKKYSELQEIIDIFENDETWQYASLREVYGSITKGIMDKYKDIMSWILKKTWVIEESYNGMDVEFLNTNPDAAAEVATNTMMEQPQKFEEEAKALDEILSNWSEEQKQVIYGIINNMPEITNLYNSIQNINNSKNDNSQYEYDQAA